MQLTKQIFTIERVKKIPPLSEDKITQQLAFVSKNALQNSISLSIRALSTAEYKTAPELLTLPDDLKANFLYATRTPYEDPNYSELSEMNALGLLDP